MTDLRERILEELESEEVKPRLIASVQGSFRQLQAFDESLEARI
jgi:hypothetical protein